MIHAPHHMLSSYQIMEDWMGRACGIYGGEEKCAQGFGKKCSMKEIVS
jgi:hypothetical protein